MHRVGGPQSLSQQDVFKKIPSPYDVRSNANLSPKSPGEGMNQDLLSHALSQAPVHQLNSDSYVG